MSIPQAAAIAIQLANEVLDVTNDSAALCLRDSSALAADGHFLAGARRAIRSISYSVGIFHPAYAKAAHALLEATDVSRAA